MEFRVDWYTSLPSTNARLREAFLEGQAVESGFLVAAHEQTAGRGRLDRRWLSAPGRDLCFSFLVISGAGPASVPSLTMAAALAVTEALEARGLGVTPKWPNDVLAGEKKICGILSERVEGAERGRAGIIVGIGLNVNMTREEADAIDRPATSIRIETGKEAPIATVLESLLPPLSRWTAKWEQGGFAALRETWTAKAGPIGKPLTVHDGATQKSGTLAGFGDHGELLLQTENGLATIWSGDVRVPPSGGSS